MFKSFIKQISPLTASKAESPTADGSFRTDYALLVNRIISGDDTAETELVNRFRSAVFHIIRRIANSSVIEDLAQDTFLKVIEKIRNGELKQPESLGSFVASVARNHALEHMRGIRRRPSEDLEQAEEVRDPAPTALEQLQTAEQFDEIRSLVRKLRPRYRELILRFYINEESKESICADLDLTAKQFDGVIHRARNSYRELYLKHKGLPKEGGD